MKKSILAFALFTAVTAAFALDSGSFTPKGSISSYTKTDYNVTSKFGDYFRSVNEKHVHVYSADGLVSESATYTARDELVDKITYKYDVSRNLVESVYSGADGVVIYKTQIEYQSDGKIKSESEYKEDGTLASKTIYKYEDAKVTESFYDGEGKLLSRIITILGENGKPAEEKQYFADGSLSLKKVYTWLDAVTVSSIEEFDETDSFVKKHVYRYDESGALSEVQTYNPSNVLCTREIYKNDSLGNPVRISVYAVAEKFGATVNELQSISEFAYKDTSAAK